MTEKRRILLVEDDVSMGFLLVDFLESNHFDVKLYRDGNSGLKAFRSGKYDFCILDVMLPGIDGFSIAERIRSEDKNIPIIFLTARAMKPDKIKGFGLGVDDYITKPFDEDELLCRIHAILNRVRPVETISKPQDLWTSIGGYEFHYQNQLLVYNSEERRLTQRETEVLRMLCREKNNIVKREDILVSVWGDNDYFHGRSLDVFIAKLRKYLSEDPEVAIENIPKVGYVLKG